MKNFGRQFSRLELKFKICEFAREKSVCVINAQKCKICHCVLYNYLLNKLTLFLNFDNNDDILREKENYSRVSICSENF